MTPDGLHLSPFGAEDRADLLEMLCQPEVRANLQPALLRTPSIEEAVANWLALPTGPEDRQLSIRIDTGRPVGFVRVEDRNLCYFIGRPFWRRGYGAAAVSALMRQGRRPGEAVDWQAFVDRNNLASRRILETNGFAFSGFLAGHTSRRSLLAYVCKAPRADQGCARAR